MNVSIAIQHHPVRAELAAALLAELGAGELVADPDPDSPARSPWRTYRHAIETTPPDADYRLILQDDVIVCPRFVEASTAALAGHASHHGSAAQHRLVTFYVGGNARLPAARVMHAAGRGRNWADITQFSWFPVVAVAWPRRLIEPMIEWANAQRWASTMRADDEIVGRFLRHRGEVPLATVPSLVDHPDDVESLIGTRNRHGRDRGRIVACWIGDCDATAVDWTEP